MSARPTGYLLSDGGRYRLERITATVHLLEHLATEGMNAPDPEHAGVALEEFAALLGLVSSELCAVLADSKTPVSAARGKGGAE